MDTSFILVINFILLIVMGILLIIFLKKPRNKKPIIRQSLKKIKEHVTDEFEEE